MKALPPPRHGEALPALPLAICKAASQWHSSSIPAHPLQQNTKLCWWKASISFCFLWWWTSHENLEKEQVFTQNVLCFVISVWALPLLFDGKHCFSPLAKTEKNPKKLFKNNFRGLYESLCLMETWSEQNQCKVLSVLHLKSLCGRCTQKIG